MDETYLKLAGRWVYLYRAIDQHGQVIDVLASPKRDLAATRRFFARALNAARRPTEVTTDRAPAYPRVLDELVPEAWHVVEQYASNPIEADHGRLKARTRPMRGLKRIRSAQGVCSGHAFIQNLRRGHYDLGFERDDRPGVVGRGLCRRRAPERVTCGPIPVTCQRRPKPLEVTANFAPEGLASTVAPSTPTARARRGLAWLVADGNRRLRIRERTMSESGECWRSRARSSTVRLRGEPRSRRRTPVQVVCSPAFCG